MTRSQVLDALNRKEEATTGRNKALAMVNAVQLLLRAPVPNQRQAR